MYLNELASVEKTLTVGGACLVTSGICSLAGYSVGKESKKISNEVDKFEMKCPSEVLDEVYESVYKRQMIDSLSKSYSTFVFFYNNLHSRG